MFILKNFEGLLLLFSQTRAFENINCYLSKWLGHRIGLLFAAYWAERNSTARSTLPSKASKGTSYPGFCFPNTQLFKIPLPQKKQIVLWSLAPWFLENELQPGFSIVFDATAILKATKWFQWFSTVKASPKSGLMIIFHHKQTTSTRRLITWQNSQAINPRKEISFL